MSNIIKIRWKNGYRTKGDAQVAYKRLEEIKEKCGGVLTAGAVVEDARKNNSPLHKQFEWDDSIAAELHRLDQGRYIIRSIQVVYEDAPDLKPQKLYVTTTQSAKKDSPERKVYRTVEETLKDPDARSELLMYAMRDAISFRRKYHMLSELASVFTAIDSFSELSEKA
jgi:hypothetical protein